MKSKRAHWTYILEPAGSWPLKGISYRHVYLIFCFCFVLSLYSPKWSWNLTGWTHRMPVHCMAAVLSVQLGSCLLCLFTSSVTLIIINNYVDMIFLHHHWNSGKVEGEWEEGRGGEKKCAQERKCPLPFVCIFFMSVTFSTHADIKVVVKCCYDVHMTVCRSFSGLILPRTRHMLW